MSNGTTPETDVIIVGAGPTGLTLAGDLATAGIRTTVVERRAEESNLTRAFGVHARTLEHLDARGLADSLLDTGARVKILRLFDRVHLDLSTLPSRYAFLLITPQSNVERLLRDRAGHAGATFRTGTEVTGLCQDDHHVEVVTADGRRLRAGYLVGADGVHSAVRTAIRQPFPGSSVITSIMLADVRLTNTPEEVLAVNAVGDCFAFVAPFGDGWYRIFAWDRTNQQPETAPLDFREIRDVTRRALGTDLGMHDPRWLSRFHSDERQVPHYRDRRVFLAGDAAHVHSPAGGQGMNTGIQDAVNLGWKLAASINRSGPADLLDSYQTERHRVGRLVLRSSGAIIRMAMVRGRPARAARNLLLGSALSIDPIARKATGVISGIGIDYPALDPGGHPLAGRRAPDIPLVGDPARLYEALRPGRFVLVAPADQANLATLRADNVTVASAADPSAPVLLVRPDAHIAWAADHTDAHQMRAALIRWCTTANTGGQRHATAEDSAEQAGPRDRGIG
jgi:2-polyprenyl-6-methoxyphenol hydroxylase-like FAD-dependent oxidoreductase